MCWAGVIEGQQIIYRTVTGFTVMTQLMAKHMDMPKVKVWPKIRNIASRLMYWFQQDGAAVHITNGVKTFHGRVISKIMEHPWPAKVWFSLHWTTCSGMWQ